MVVKSLLLYLLSGLLLLSALVSFTPISAAEDKPVKPAPPSEEPRVNIEPRVRPSKEAEDPAASRETSIRVETQLVLINVTVTDPMNVEAEVIRDSDWNHACALRTGRVIVRSGPNGALSLEQMKACRARDVSDGCMRALELKDERARPSLEPQRIARGVC